MAGIAGVSRAGAYLSVSFLPAVFLRFGVGILQSMEKATQLVHGTPRLAASHRTYCVVSMVAVSMVEWIQGRIEPFARDTSGKLLAGPSLDQTKATHLTSPGCALPGKPVSGVFRKDDSHEHTF